MRHWARWATTTIIVANLATASGQDLSGTAPTAAATQASRSAIQQAIESRGRLLERIQAERPAGTGAVGFNDRVEPGLSAGPPGVPDVMPGVSGGTPGPQSGTGRLPEIVRERRNDFFARLQQSRPHAEGDYQTGASGSLALPDVVQERRSDFFSRLQQVRPHAAGDSTEGASFTPGGSLQAGGSFGTSGSFGLQSAEKNVDANRNHEHDPGTNPEPPGGTFPPTVGLPPGVTNVRNPGGNIDINVDLTQRLAELDLMRDRAIDNGDPGALENVDRLEKLARQQLTLPNGDPGSNGSGGKRPEPPLPPGGRAGFGWFSGFRGSAQQNDNARREF